MNYYISTGAKTGFYTLRYKFQEQTGYNSETGFVNTGVADRDYYVQNLSTDRDEAIRKAKELCGFDLSIDFSLDEIKRHEHQDVDWSIFQAGKHCGESIHAVKESDPGYLVWMCEQISVPKAYVKTVALAKALVAHELEQRKGERQDKIDGEKALAEKQIDAFGRDFVDARDDEALRGMLADRFENKMCRQLKRGQTIGGRALDIMMDIRAKCEGRRGSKLYTAELDRLQDLLLN